MFMQHVLITYFFFGLSRKCIHNCGFIKYAFEHNINVLFFFRHAFMLSPKVYSIFTEILFDVTTTIAYYVHFVFMLFSCCLPYVVNLGGTK